MLPKFDENLILLAGRLGKPLYAVGGYVRNALLGYAGTDIDLASALSDEELYPALESAGFTVEAVYKRTGTVMFRGSDGTHYEHTRFRAEKYKSGGGHTPEVTYPTEDIAEDARRRDFKCNAVYYDIAAKTYVDPLGGIHDIKNKILDAVTEPEKVFRSDGLRLMRLCRFAGELGFTPTDGVMSAAKKYADNIRDISPERIYDELIKILLSDGKYEFSPKYAQYRALKILHETGVLSHIMPELTLGDGMAQRSDFHDYDVLEHSLRTVMYADKSIRLAALLHDVGKPYAMTEHGAYATHAADGKRIAREILTRLKAPKCVTEEVCRLVGAHMLDIDLAARESKVRRYIAEYSDILDKLLLLKQADYSACKDDLSAAPAVVKWRAVYEKMKAENAPFIVSELKINGDDLKALGFSGREIGETLKTLFFNALINPKLNDREKLTAAAKRLGGKERL